MAPLFYSIKSMLRTKNLITSIYDVPREWVFEHYLQLGEQLTGQDVKIKSIFNPNDKLPSFFVYYAKYKRKYMFKDFSTDDHGDGTHLVQLMFKLSSRGESAQKIVNDYNKHVITNGDEYTDRLLRIRNKYKVTGFSLRNWTVIDQKFWTSFNIGSKLLKKFNVRPLKNYTMSKEEDGKIETIEIKHHRIYGFFRKDGTLYKIYQPFSRSSKFIKVESYTQGADQLTFEKPYLIICSSLKDMMAFHTLGFNNAETIAPDSENIIISNKIIDVYKKRYKSVITLFDNDAPGRKSMKKYKKEYDIDPVHLSLEKDVADCSKAHGIKATREHLYPLLTKALSGTAKKL